MTYPIVRAGLEPMVRDSARCQRTAAIAQHPLAHVLDHSPISTSTPGRPWPSLVARVVSLIARMVMDVTFQSAALLPPLATPSRPSGSRDQAA